MNEIEERDDCAENSKCREVSEVEKEAEWEGPRGKPTNLHKLPSTQVFQVTEEVRHHGPEQNQHAVPNYSTLNT